MRIILLAAAAVAALSIAGCDRQSDRQSQADAEAEAPARPGGPGLDRSQAGKALPDMVVRDPAGEEIALASLRGKPLLVNLWATWCAPCVKELPTLDALADRAGSPQVIALSQDSASFAKVQSFLAEKKIGLDPYQDAEMTMSSALGVQILPTTILYGADGKEIWRWTGDLDWTGPKAARLLKEAR